jgi:hypothetical protein
MADMFTVPDQSVGVRSTDNYVSVRKYSVAEEMDQAASSAGLTDTSLLHQLPDLSHNLIYSE